METEILDRLRKVSEITSDPKSTVYAKIEDELFVKPVKVGATSVWPRSETLAIVQARIAGLNDEQIRALVRKLEANRLDLRQRLLIELAVPCVPAQQSPPIAQVRAKRAVAKEAEQ